MNDMHSVVAALQPRLHEDSSPIGSSAGGGIDRARADAMLADITSQPRHDSTTPRPGSGSVTALWQRRSTRRVLLGAAAAVVAVGTVTAGLLGVQKGAGGDAADCIPRLRHDDTTYTQHTVIEGPINDNVRGLPAFGAPAGTGIIGTCNDDGAGAGRAVTFPPDAPKVDVVELTDIAPSIAIVRPQSDGSAAVFIVDGASAQQVEQVLAKVPAG